MVCVRHYFWIALIQQTGICEHTSELPLVFGTVSDVSSMGPVNCTWDNQTRTFSNGIISHWISFARTGRPLSSWASYNPFTPKHFHMTPDQGFLSETWNRNCSFFDQMEAEKVRDIFGIDTYVDRSSLVI